MRWLLLRIQWHFLVRLLTTQKRGKSRFYRQREKFSECQWVIYKCSLCIRKAVDSKPNVDLIHEILFGSVHSLNQFLLRSKRSTIYIIFNSSLLRLVKNISYCEFGTFQWDWDVITIFFQISKEFKLRFVGLLVQFHCIYESYWEKN